MGRALGRAGCLFSLLDLLTIILVFMKLDKAIDLSWFAVTMPTWGPILLVFLFSYVFAHGGRRRSTRRRRSSVRRAPARRRRAPARRRSFW